MAKLARLLLPFVLMSSAVFPLSAAAAERQLVMGETLSAGKYHACGVSQENTVICWGTLFGRTKIPSDLEAVTQVSVGEYHTCVLTISGAVRCWGGSNQRGEIDVPSDLETASQVSSGSLHTCALTTSSAVRCWGGQPNQGATVVPSDLGPVLQISAGHAHTCALLISHVVRCWGLNVDGQAAVPSDLGLVTQVSAGGTFTCALTASGFLRCWGKDELGLVQLAPYVGDVTQISSGYSGFCALRATGSLECLGTGVAPPDNLGVVAQVSQGYGLSCAQTTVGIVRCWGPENSQGQTNVPNVYSPVTQVATGYNHTCSLTASGSVRCWGLNDYGQTTIPPDLGKVTQISAGYSTTCALIDDGSTRCWGQHGGVVSDLGRATQISSGGSHACALTSSSSVRCWGLNSDGRATVPVDLGIVTQVNAGYFHTCALIVTGAVRCWGEAQNFRTTVPTDLGEVKKISLSANHTCAITTSGAVRCWGEAVGAIPSNLSEVTQLSSGYRHTCALTASAAVRCWGNTGDGRTNVPSDLGLVSEISAGGSHTCALTALGSIRCWGLNSNGQTNVPANVSESNFPIVFKQTVIRSIGVLKGSITGNLSIGSVVEADFDLKGLDTRYYQWFRDGVMIAGANSSSYVITEDDFGTNLSVSLGYADGENISYGSSTQRFVDFPLVSSAIPIIVGEKIIGNTVTAEVPDWDEGASFSYQWLRNGQAVNGATSKSYFIELADLGQNLTVRVTGSKDRHRSVTQTSNVHDILSSIPNSPCPGPWDTSESLAANGNRPSFDAISFPPTAGMSLKGANGIWPLGTKFCVFWVANGYQVIPGANTSIYQSRFIDAGDSIQYVVVGTDKNGKRSIRYSYPGIIQPCVGSNVSAKSVNAINGVATRISGSVKTCSAAKTIQYREKAFGKGWGSWRDYPTSEVGKFSINRTFLGNSKYQIRVNNAGTWMSSNELDVKVRIKYSRPLSFSWKQTRIPQGFTQGGVITVKFTGDREFSGRCLISGVTDYAFNFALTPMGSESRMGWFNVRNGTGTGKIRMTWNGQVYVAAACTDPKFQDVIDFRFPVFTADF